MKTKYLYLLGLLLLGGFVSCELDNYDEPEALLEGRVVYEGQPLSVRTNSAEFELWQDGYALNEFIPVYIAQDGTYSASLFNGEYKLVRKGGDPWLPQLNDTIVIQVNGKTQQDVSVTPYFTISNENINISNNTLTATFDANKIVESSNLQEAVIVLGKRFLVDENIWDAISRFDADEISLDGESTLEMQIPEELRGLEYLFVRIGLKSNSTNEYIYTQSQRIEL